MNIWPHTEDIYLNQAKQGINSYKACKDSMLSVQQDYSVYINILQGLKKKVLS